MKLYILRHEERVNDATFFAPLTEDGLNNSIKLVYLLEQLNINKIYCSPFIRTLQTIGPYSNKHKIPINIDYGLVEIQHESIIPQKSFNVSLPEYIAKNYNINNDYKTLITNKDLVWPEDINKLNKRTKKMFKYIIKNNYNDNKNILVVTHQGVCKSIINVIKKKQKEKLLTIDDNYKMGKLSLIFSENDWNYKEIN
jgi:broad specificity phosphatase PhoE